MLKVWFNSSDPCQGNIDKAFELVNIILDLLKHIQIKGGNARKNAYISCAWYVMNYCFDHETLEFNMRKINSLKKDIQIELPIVGGDHSGRLQRQAFKRLIEQA